jgi:hypothetical protein
MAITLALLWGGCLLSVGLVNLIVPTYGARFLEMMSSVYPGFYATHTAGDVVVGTLVGSIDGAIAGALIAWLYNKLSGVITQPAEHAGAEL